MSNKSENIANLSEIKLRPTSNKIALYLGAFISAIYVYYLLENTTESLWVTVLKLPQMAVMIFLTLLIFLILKIGKWRRFAYYGGVLILGLWLLRFLQGTYYILNNYFMDHDNPDYIESRIPYHMTISFVLLGLMTWLFISFSFGTANRRYFGFKVD